MKVLTFLSVILLILAGVFCSHMDAAEQVDASQLIVSPDKYAGRTVKITVRFNKINTLFRGWEDQANLKQSRKIKFMAIPLGEIACYADKTDANEEILGKLKRGQDLTISGYLKKCKMETKIKVNGDGPRRDRTVKREIKGSAIFVFIVKKIDSVGEAPSGRFPGMGRDRRRNL